MQTWVAIAVLAGVLVVGLVGRSVWQARPQPEMRGLPPTPLEKLGWIGLGVTTVVGLGLGALVAVEGAADVFEDTTSRIFWILLLSGIGVWTAGWFVIKRRSGQAVVDERDRAILARSFSVESAIVILCLVTWTVVLTEVYGDEGAVPVGYLQLIFWSTYIAGAFGRSLGIVWGYRRGIAVDA